MLILLPGHPQIVLRVEEVRSNSGIRKKELLVKAKASCYMELKLNLEGMDVPFLMYKNALVFSTLQSHSANISQL